MNECNKNIYLLGIIADRLHIQLGSQYFTSYNHHPCSIFPYGNNSNNKETSKKERISYQHLQDNALGVNSAGQIYVGWGVHTKREETQKEKKADAS